MAGGLLPAAPVIQWRRAGPVGARAGRGRAAGFPMALLHVLAHAAVATREGVGVSLPGGVRAVPAPLARP